MRPDVVTRYRVGLDHGPRFFWRKGSNPKPYGTWRLGEAEDEGYIILCEGETDAAACWQHGLPALGIPGATSWKSEWAEYLARVPTVYAWQEPGAAGAKFVEALARDLPEVYVIQAPAEAKDPCQLAQQDPESFFGRMLGLMAEAEPPPCLEEDAVLFTATSLNGTQDDDDPWCAEAERLFPVPPGQKPAMHGVARYSERDGELIFLNHVSNNWNFEVNAVYKRRHVYRNVGPRLVVRPGPWFERSFPLDDWSDSAREALKEHISRLGKRDGAKYLYFWIDNLLSAGVVRVLTDAPLPDWEPAGDIAQWLAAGLAAITPVYQGKGKRFRPYGGSRELTTRAEEVNEDDRGRWKTIAISQDPMDFVQVQAVNIAQGRDSRLVRRYWRRSQWGSGLVVKVNSLEDARELVECVGGFYLTRQAYAGEPREETTVSDTS
jgi:hypothetical protein